MTNVAISFIFCICLLAVHVHAVSDPTVPPKHTQKQTYIYWQGDASQARRSYEQELMHKVFEHSVESYGEANLEFSQWKITTSRAIELMREGEHLHMQSAPLGFRHLDKKAISVLPYRILKNVLGYRHVIVKDGNQNKFHSIQDFEQFAKLVPGQGHDWSDVVIYESNGINVAKANGFDGLFSMLYHGRFDYVPLGVAEAKMAVEAVKTQYKDLRMVDNLIIYYPFPVNFCVTKQYPELEARIRYGMEKAIASGDFDNIFSKHFAHIVEQINRRETKIIYLNTPGYPSQNAGIGNNYRGVSVVP